MYLFQISDDLIRFETTSTAKAPLKVGVGNCRTTYWQPTMGTCFSHHLIRIWQQYQDRRTSAPAGRGCL